MYFNNDTSFIRIYVVINYIWSHNRWLDEEGKVTISKTGLGSSAALTCSLVGALLQWFDVIRIGLRPDSEDRRIVHNLSQLVHGNAQGKIGNVY